MTVRFAVEMYRQLRADADALRIVEDHFVEVAPGSIPLALDHGQFEWMCQNNILHIVTARDEGKLVGYHFTICKKHLHRDCMAGYVDAFYVDPEHRTGRTAMRLFQYAEETLMRRGVKWIYSGSKNVKDVGRLMEYLGYTDIERVYLKVLP